MKLKGFAPMRIPHIIEGDAYVLKCPLVSKLGLHVTLVCYIYSCRAASLLQFVEKFGKCVSKKFGTQYIASCSNYPHSQVQITFWQMVHLSSTLSSLIFLVGNGECLLDM
jgi:hypothetical protein